MVIKPLLPPKTGYVESRDVAGTPVNVPIPEQIEKERKENQIAFLQDENIQVKVQLLQADETAITLFETQLAQDSINTQQDEAIIAIYEMIGGTSI